MTSRLPSVPSRRSTDVNPALRPTTPTPATPAQPGTRPATGTPTDFTAGNATGVQTRLSTIRSLLSGHTDRKEETALLALFKNANAGELNQLINGLSRQELHEVTSDMNDRLFGPDNKTAFLSLLTKERVGDLTVESRAKLVQALQINSTDGKEEKAIGALFLATKGEGLSALKNAIDGGSDHRDLQQLIFHDIDDGALRTQLLAHFKTEATPKDGKVKVLSDIDDTFYANWKDDRFPKKTIYPGVRALYAELDRGGGATADRTGDLMFLSARPYDRPGVSEHFSREMMHDHGVTQATVLSGDFAHLIGNHSIADKKFENWQQVNQLYPEYGSVFLGDSGQGDAIFGAKAAAANADMRSVFIHNVTHMDAAGKAAEAQKGVFVFDTYVGAATEAFKRGLISKGGLERVMNEAHREFAALTFSSPEQKSERKAELDRDTAAARSLL
ncbi:MAG: hypothetical protein JNM17_22810 [Archangium sp.]|nr:hypothetical protein [Archangium sp.]